MKRRRIPSRTKKLAPPLREGMVYSNKFGFIDAEKYRRYCMENLDGIDQLPTELKPIDKYEPGDPEWREEYNSFVDPNDYPLYFKRKR